MTDFVGFNKIARLSRNCVITEKIDGTNGQIYISEDGEFLVGSRNRWLGEGKDNAGFYKWAMEYKEELLTLGTGHHFGEWWGSGIQRRYGLEEKRFSLFNVGLWTEENTPDCCHVVPVLNSGLFTTELVNDTLRRLEIHGSKASPGFMNPEGIVVWHESARIYFKKTIKGDESPKGRK